MLLRRTAVVAAIVAVPLAFAAPAWADTPSTDVSCSPCTWEDATGKGPWEPMFAGDPWGTAFSADPWGKAFSAGSWEKAFAGDPWGKAFANAPMP